LSLAGSASASQLVARNASNIKLAVNAKGTALVTYSVRGRVTHLLAWGAVNARQRPSNPKIKQVEFKLDYSGGYGKYKQNYWETFGSDCGHYGGPALAWVVAVCTAPDGSNWALQAWPRGLPNYGVSPTAEQAAFELHLSHWTGGLAVLTVKTDWAYKRFDHLYGSFVYEGTGVYGFHSTPTGLPLDDFGRNLYVDTLGSVYGDGWKRENSFLSHRPNGTFCYGFFSHGSHPSGKGTKYRATIMGPGVTPDVMLEGEAPGPYKRAQGGRRLGRPGRVVRRQALQADLSGLSWNRARRGALEARGSATAFEQVREDYLPQP
jgi:hypothetical protein